MGAEKQIVTQLHRRTERDCLSRMLDDKVHCMGIAKRYAQDFWDGDRRYGYGGYAYDGRWEVVASQLIEEYGLEDDAKILDVGCGKGYLLFEFTKLLPECQVRGLDISEYALANAKEDVKSSLSLHRAQDPLPFAENEFDLVVSITTLHNLQVYDLQAATTEVQRVGKHGYIVVESFRNDQELFNLQCWALTCESFFTPEEWVWLFGHFGYDGDYEFIFFE